MNADAAAFMLSTVPVFLSKSIFVGAVYDSCGFHVQAFCCYGATKLKVDDTDAAFIPDGSYLIDTNNARDK